MVGKTIVQLSYYARSSILPQKNELKELVVIRMRYHLSQGKAGEDFIELTFELGILKDEEKIGCGGQNFHRGNKMCTG